MVEESGGARVGEARVSTGNPSLDRMLEGGLVARRPYLIVGPSGTGKTTLALQFLVDGIHRGERALLVTLEEPPNEIRMNHRGMQPTLDRVDVFDAIPDIMRYERTPFKDIAAVRSASPFADVPLEIRRSPELASVEVTITALEQMLRTEVIRRGYTRVVIDSLTALQYFCMKGFEPVTGAQSFLRFLSDLRVTTLLTVESPLEDVETPERMLARGEIRLFRWELEGQTVRAVGVEKFRGSSHDARLHPYRIGPKGIDINLEVTISRDTRQIIEPLVRPPVPPTAVTVAPFVSSVTPLVDEVRDLVLLGADVHPARQEIEAALSATNAGRLDEAQTHLSRVSSLVIRLVDSLGDEPRPFAETDASASAAYQRVLARADAVRTGVPPTSLPEPAVLQVQLGALLSLLPPTPPPPLAGPPVPRARAEPVEESTTLPAAPPAIEAPLPPPPPPPETVESVIPSPETVSVPEELTASVPAAEVAEPVPIPEPAVLELPPVIAPVPSSAESPPAAAPAESTPTAREPAPALVSETPTAPTVERPHEPVRSSRTATKKVLPPPPKPRSTVAAPQLPRESVSVTPRDTTGPSEPPPLPSTQVPEWEPTTADPGAPRGPASPEPALPSASPPSAGPPAHPTGRPAAAPAKRRRKVAASPAGHKRTAAASRTHELSDATVPLPAPPMSIEPPKMPTAPVAEPTPSNPVESIPKSRKRTPRKRKAPPVVSAEVAPIPPGVFGSEPETPSRKDSSEAPPPPEE